MVTPLERLIKALARLPSVGRRSAERMALGLVRNRGGVMREVLAALQEVEQTVCCCSRCGAVTTRERDPCELCTDPRRDSQLLCIVSDPADVLQLEASGAYRGRYHVLAGKLSPMQGEGVEDLRVEQLQARIRKEAVREVILALDTDVESDATATFLHDLLGRQGVRVTRPAMGIPVGSGIAYADAVSLERAMHGRRDMD